MKFKKNQYIGRNIVVFLLVGMLMGLGGCDMLSRKAFKARIQARREASMKKHQMRLIAAERGYMPASLIDPRAVGCPMCESRGKLPASGKECPTCQGQRAVVSNFGVVYTYSIDAQIRLAALRRQIGKHNLAKKDLKEVVQILDKQGSIKQYATMLLLFEDVLGDDRLLAYRYRYVKGMLTKKPMLDRHGNVARWHRLDGRIVKGEYGFERLVEMLIDADKQKKAATLVYMLMGNKGYDQNQYLKLDNKKISALLHLDTRWLDWNNEVYKGVGSMHYMTMIKDVDYYGHWLNAKGEMGSGVLKYAAGEVPMPGIYDEEDTVRGQLISIKLLGNLGLWDKEVRAKMQEKILRNEIEAKLEERDRVEKVAASEAAE
ncbi:hypothetical protein JD969_20610 [Planctomycetota bacterium]|nr:hypothetical protein JD969_20610 [Planctomycetota bacterium]